MWIHTNKIKTAHEQIRRSKMAVKQDSILWIEPWRIARDKGEEVLVDGSLIHLSSGEQIVVDASFEELTGTVEPSRVSGPPKNVSSDNPLFQYGV